MTVTGSRVTPRTQYPRATLPTMRGRTTTSLNPVSWTTGTVIWTRAGSMVTKLPADSPLACRATTPRTPVNVSLTS